jgi:trehalose-phosphatase
MTRPSALEQFDRIWREVKANPVVFLDYDGTLTPIVERPEAAVLAEETRAVLRLLAQRSPVAVVSGRDLADVRKRVGIPGINYAGSHGFDIAGPSGEHVHGQALAAAPQLRAAAEDLARDTARVAGVQLERKRFSLAIHYRRASEADVPAVETAVDRARARHPGLRKTHGKKVFQLQPDVAWDKGRAVLWLLGALGLENENVRPIYIGDDVTDEDAFRALAGRGISIAVQEAPGETAARFALRDSHEVREFLARLARSLPER